MIRHSLTHHCMKRLPLLIALSVITAAAPAAFDPGALPAPRTWIVAGQQEAFREYCTNGDGAAMFNAIKTDFDRDCLTLPFPEEPDTYGDPDPAKRTSDKADMWRAAQDTCGLVSRTAEAATLIWLVTGEDVYLERARTFLLGSLDWPLDGVSGIDYNDEAHFRLWRKLPLVYDQIRDQLTEEERALVLENFRLRGDQSVVSIRSSGIEGVQRNSLVVEPKSHAVRFMPMTGLTGLALWDDLPDEAPEWWAFARDFYDHQFTPWGGDDGGWAEGLAYWRGIFEHATFEDARLALHDPGAFANPFWANTGYFALYFIPPYKATAFGDTPVEGKINLEPGIAHFMRHLGRVFDNGDFTAYADLYQDPRPLPETLGLGGLGRMYPTSGELLVRQFIVSSRPSPKPADLDALPQSRFFADVGWVSMHSSLGQPEEDIMLSFKASPYGSYSHSHADQNAFILNAYGRNLAINAGYREYHGSPQHHEFTRQTLSKNAVLIGGEGQEARDKTATGAIVNYRVGPRYVLTTGDATAAYAARQPDNRIEQVLRDVLMIDRRFFVVRDRIELTEPAPVSWQLHAENPITVDQSRSRLTVEEDQAFLLVRLEGSGTLEEIVLRDTFPTPTDPKYVARGWGEQGHFRADFAASDRHTIVAVLWTVPPEGLREFPDIGTEEDGSLVVARPDGLTTRIRFLESGIEVEDL